MLLYK